MTSYLQLRQDINDMLLTYSALVHSAIQLRLSIDCDRIVMQECSNHSAKQHCADLMLNMTLDAMESALHCGNAIWPVHNCVMQHCADLV